MQTDDKAASPRGLLPYRRVLAGTGLICCLVGNGGADSAGYSDTAPVLAVTPIVERIYTTVRQQNCREPAPPPLLPLARTPGDDIRRQLSLADTATECHWEEQTRPVERVQGYQVTYSYAGRRYTRRMQRHPGARVSVRVALEPMPY